MILDVLVFCALPVAMCALAVWRIDSAFDEGDRIARAFVAARPPWRRPSDDPSVRAFVHRLPHEMQEARVATLREHLPEWEARAGRSDMQTFWVRRVGSRAEIEPSPFGWRARMRFRGSIRSRFHDRADACIEAPTLDALAHEIQEEYDR